MQNTSPDIQNTSPDAQHPRTYIQIQVQTYKIKSGPSCPILLYIVLYHPILDLVYVLFPNSKSSGGLLDLERVRRRPAA